MSAISSRLQCIELLVKQSAPLRDILWYEYMFIVSVNRYVIFDVFFLNFVTAVQTTKNEF